MSNKKKSKSSRKSAVVDAETPLFEEKPNGRVDYGTNNTLELLEQIPSQIVDMKLDEVLTAVKVVDNLCKFEKCKTKTSLMGHDCGLCKQRYCIKHLLPEVHGCGEAVKVDERKKFMHPKTAKMVQQEKDHEKSKKRLEGKLKDMRVARMQKSNTKKK